MENHKIDKLLSYVPSLKIIIKVLKNDFPLIAAKPKVKSV